ncbi:MAG: hypothetical protein ACD_19C00405G0001 [uncultured bacterium]|nr:MAG: hypothetical protein ACD_19C00405G0001 [uncultured bacterium]
MESNKKIIKDIADVHDLFTSPPDEPVTISITQPIATPFLQLLRKKGFSFRRVGFREWSISPSFFVQSEEIERSNVIIALRALFLFISIVMLIKVALFFSQSFWGYWRKLENNMLSLPIIASTIAGIISAFIVKAKLKNIKFFLRRYLGLM